jgi:hypothetical protein
MEEWEGTQEQIQKQEVLVEVELEVLLPVVVVDTQGVLLVSLKI